jgi:hypothetical protein
VRAHLPRQLSAVLEHLRGACGGARDASGLAAHAQAACFLTQAPLQSRSRKRVAHTTHSANAAAAARNRLPGRAAALVSLGVPCPAGGRRARGAPHARLIQHGPLVRILARDAHAARRGRRRAPRPREVLIFRVHLSAAADLRMRGCAPAAVAHRRARAARCAAGCARRVARREKRRESAVQRKGSQVHRSAPALRMAYLGARSSSPLHMMVRDGALLGRSALAAARAQHAV